ncbi:aspartate-alanine antiporter [Tateyamaria pelophila]|uniref:aspartate-alanine antiporter n=1 Tax=Tateyamaria pelophila TaxID=328415 RepID=UPI001CBFB5FB|nr:aspartate-alanine antiporter [Tateyamaria pelophila]
MSYLAAFMIEYPELSVFLTISLGYLIGSVKIGDFSFGPVAGSLFAGLLIGQFAEVPIAGMAKSYLFLLFLFGIGYSAGPQFLTALRRGGAQPVLVALACTVTGLAISYVVARLLGLDPGYAAGLLSGGLTQSPAIGSAGEAIARLPLEAEEIKRLTAHVAVGYAVCYVVGSAGAIWFCSYMGPKLLGVDLQAAAADLGRSLGIDDPENGVESGYRQFQLRAYCTPESASVIGETLAEVERRFAGHRLFVLRLRRGDQILDADPALVIEAGDVLAISGPRAAVIEHLSPKAQEVEDPALLDIPFQAAKVVVTGSDVVGQTLRDIAARPWARGLYLKSITRGGHDIPVAPGITLESGDMLDVIGPQDILAKAASNLGRELKPTQATDFVVLGLMIFVGGLIGVLMRFSVFGIEVGLGTSVGALLAGLLTGYLGTRNPFFGRIPDGSVALMTSLGLASFIAMVGLQAAPSLIPAIMEVGLVLPLGGFVVVIIPLLAGLLLGHFVFKMNPILLLGAIAGSLTSTPSMAAVQARSGSPLPVLGYAPAYPVAQIILTLWGSIIVQLIA